MAQEIEKFDPSTLMQGVKDRIKATFVSLIPDDQWDAMVKKEIDSFFNDPMKITMSKKEEKQGGYWSSAAVYSVKEVEQTAFRNLVWEMCIEKATVMAKKQIMEQIGDAWPLTEDNIPQKMKEIVEAAIPVAINTFFQKIAYSQMAELRSSIQNTH